MITNVQQIRSAANIVEIIGEYVKLKKKGANYLGCCPFHSEKSPSFTVHPAKQFYKCFGCGKSGDVISFLMEHERLSFNQAVLTLSAKTNIEAENDVQRFEKPVPRLEKLPANVINWFEERKISNNTLLRLGVTYSAEWMPKNQTKEEVICFNYKRNDELFNIKYRSFRHKDFRLNKDSEVSLYNIDALKGETNAVIVEGEIDVLACHESGVYNTVGLPGSQMVNKINLQDIAHIQRFILFCDNDAAGIKATEDLADLLGRYRCSVVKFPEDCKDANEILIKFGPDAVKEAVESAEPMYQLPKNTEFPLHIFPEHYQRSIEDVCDARNISIQFAATAGLWTISSLAGSRYYSDFNGDARNILFCLLVAPVSVGKTPAFKVMCESPLKIAHEISDRQWAEANEQYKQERESNPDKKYTLKKPKRFIPIAVDGTTEGYIHKSMSQPNGIGVYQDEAETIFNAGSFKSNNDAVSFFTQAFSGGRISQVRVDDEKERVVPNLNLNLLMGTQKSRLSNIFTADRLASGFASRFLMVESDYQELNTDADPFSQKKEMCERWVTMVTELFFEGQNFNAGEGQQVYIRMSDEAKETYRSYYRQLLQDANGRINSKADSYVIGTEAKMSAYFPRLCQILSILHNHHMPVITEETVHNAWQLYRYYAESTIRIIGGMHQEIETGLPADLELLYQALPAEFTRSDAVIVCERLNLNPRRFDVSIRRKDFSKLFSKSGQGQYRKI